MSIKISVYGKWMGLVWLSLLPRLAMAHEGPTEVSGYTIFHYTDENGLPQNSVKAIAPDPLGFVWMLTEGGLVRYDGKEFYVFNKSNTDLTSGRMLGFLPGIAPGDIYAVNDKYELLHIRGGKVVPLGVPPPMYAFIHKQFLSGERGEAKFGHPVYRRELLGNRFFVQVADHISFYAYSGNTIRYYVGPNQTYGFKRTEGPGEHFFMVAGHLYIHLGGNRFMAPYPLDITRSFTVPGLPASVDPASPPLIYWNDITGDSYFYRDNRLFRLSRRADGVLDAVLLFSGFDLQRHNIYTIHRYNETGDLFLGSSTEGLYVFKKHDFGTLNTGMGGVAEVFYAHDTYGDSAVISPQGYILSPGKPPVLMPAVKDEGDFARYCILSDKNGGGWATRENRLYRFDASFRVVSVDTFPDQIYQIYQTPDSTLWIGGRNRGLYRLRPDVPGARYTLFLPVVHNSYLLRSGPDHLWVGSVEGLYRVSLKDRHVDTVPGLNGVYVRSLYGDNPSELWITSYDDGLFLLRNGILTKLPLDGKDYLASSHCMLEDTRGNFWISTNKGLFQVPKADLLAYADGRTQNVYYYYYGKESGFNTNEFNGGGMPCGLRWPNGNFSFPSLNGLVWFNPDKVKPEFPDKGIFVNRVELDGKPVEPADSLTLAYDFRRLTLYISTPYLGNPNNLYLETSLQSSSDDDDHRWTELGGDNSLSFTTLPPGTYRVVIRKRNGFGVDNYTYRTLVLIVPSPFWQTGWFMMLAVLAFTAGVYYLIRWRTRYVRRRNLELERIIRERTLDLRETITALSESKNTLGRQSQLQQKMILAFSHDLKSPLMYLMITGQKLYESLRDTPGKVRNSIQVMYHSSFSMYHFTDNFLNYAKVYFLNENPARETFSLHALVEEKADIFKYIAHSKNIAVLNRVSPDTQVHMNRMLLAIIIHNLLDNATKYTDEGHIEFTVTQTPGYLELAIADTGMGMDDHVKKQYADIFHLTLTEEYVNEGAGKGLGLQIVTELMHILKGRLHIESEEGKGTTIYLRFSEEG